MKNKFTLITALVLFVNCIPARSQWVRMATSPDASVRDLLVVGTKLFAACSYGVYFSPDDGATWAQRNGDFPNMDARSLVSDGSDLYVASGGLTEAAIYKSSDFGITWVDVTPTNLAGFRQEPTLALDGTNIYVSTAYVLGMPGGVLLKSSLSGVSPSSWTDFTNGLPVTSSRLIDIRSLRVHGTKIYAGTSGDGIWISDTSSPAWSETSGMIPDADYILRSMFFKDNIAFAGSSGNPVVYRSTDNGINWMQSSTSIFNDKPVYSIISDQTNVYAGTEGNGVLKSSDNGITWTAFNDGFQDQFGNWACFSINVRSLVLKENTIFAGTDCGVWKRQPGVTPPPVTIGDSLINIYPNPANNTITLKVGPADIGTNLIIKDAAGTILLQKQIANETTSIEISGLATGMYFIRVGNQNRRSIKFIKR